MIVEEGCTVVGSEFIPVLVDLCCEVEDDELHSVAESPFMWQLARRCAPVRVTVVILLHLSDLPERLRGGVARGEDVGKYGGAQFTSRERLWIS
jgi:hypothetical protein